MEFCSVCKHCHKFEQGEICGVCGHRGVVSTTTTTTTTVGFENSLAGYADIDMEKPLLDACEILTNFLYLGSYNDVFNLALCKNPQLIKASGASHVLNTVPGWKYPSGRVLTCYYLQKGKSFPCDDAIQFLDQCEKDKVRVLVFCMTGNNRSAAIIMAYLMKCKGWRLGQSYEWVKQRRASIDLSPGVNRQLKEYEQKILGSAESSRLPMNRVSEKGFPEKDDAAHVSALSNLNIKTNSENVATPFYTEPPVAQPRERRALHCNDGKDANNHKKVPARKTCVDMGHLCILPGNQLESGIMDMHSKYTPVIEKKLTRKDVMDFPQVRRQKVLL